MPENEYEYSGYIKHISNRVSALALFSSFIFTRITVLITRLPHVSSLPSQLVLLVATAFDACALRTSSPA